MPRAKSKQQLLAFSTEEYQNLMTLVASLTPHQQTEMPVFDNRTVQDIMAHLHAWHLLVLTWYAEGMAGNKPDIPAPGYTWKMTPELNEKLYQDFKNHSWNDVLHLLNESHQKLLHIVEGHSDEELTVKKKYAWTGSTNMASYFASSLASHYHWAIVCIKKAVKMRS